MSTAIESKQLFRLDGKVAVVTGGSRGLGLYAAAGILKAGAKTVFLVARKSEGPYGLNAGVKYLNGLAGVSGRVVPIAADLSNTSEIERVVKTIQAEEAFISILVANAGATWGGPLETTPDASSAKVLDLNVRSVFNLVRLSIGLLTAGASASDPARIIIVGSIAGFTVQHVGQNSTIMYSASKAAAHHMARNLAVELGPRHINTNAISPGFFPSKLANGLINKLGGEEELGKSNPCGRLGRQEDIEGAVVFLCSVAGSYVNGVVLPLDGGVNLAATAARL